MSDPIETNQLATKQDVNDAEQRLNKKLDELKIWLLNREVTAIRWFVGTQLTYAILTIGAMYFIVGHMAPTPQPIVIQLPIPK